jgi:hypothetical protein
MNSNKIDKFVLRPAMTGVAAYALTYAFIGNEGFVPVLSAKLSPAMAIATVAVAGELTGTLLVEQLKNSGQSSDLVNLEGAFIKPLITGVLMVGISSVVIERPGSMQGLAKYVALGVTAASSGSYLSDAVVPMLPM